MPALAHLGAAARSEAKPSGDQSWLQGHALWHLLWSLALAEFFRFYPHADGTAERAKRAGRRKRRRATISVPALAHLGAAARSEAKPSGDQS